MTAIFTQKAIQDIVGPEYRVKAARGNGNFQVNLELKGTGLTGKRKCELALAAFEKLKAAGYPLDENDLKTDSRGADGVWRSWFCIYVNKPEASRGDMDPSTFAAAVSAGVAATLKALGIKGQEQEAPEHAEPEVIEIPEDMPV